MQITDRCQAVQRLGTLLTSIAPLKLKLGVDMRQRKALARRQVGIHGEVFA